MGVFKRWRKAKDGSKTVYWYIRYSVNGNEKWESAGKVGVVTKDVARAKLEERKRQVRLGQLGMIGARIPTLSDFAKDYIKHVRDAKQKRSWNRDEYGLRHFVKLFGDRKLSEITSKDVDDFKEIRLKEVAAATVNRELQIVRHLFNLAKRWKKFFSENPVSEAKLICVNNQKERILTREEEEKLLGLCNPYLKPIFITALNTGMRKNEILTLKWKDIDRDTNVITLEHTNTKSKKMRRIPINSVLRKLLFVSDGNVIPLRKEQKSEGPEFVFLSEDGKPYKRHDSLRAFERLCKKAGISGLRFHDLRHTAATRMIEAGASIVAVSRILGHSDIKITMRYAHPEESLKDAVEKLSNFTLNSSQNRSQDNLEN